MTAAIKNEYDTLTTDLRRVTDGGRTPRHYHERWLRRRGLLPRPGGGKIEKFRRIARYRTVTTEDILRDHMPRIAESEYHYYRWNVGILLCTYCGERLTRDSRTEDHVIPRCRGGGLLGRDNLEPACQPCNLAKGDLSLLCFLLSRRETTARGV